MFRNVRIALGFFLLVASVVLLIWGFWPVHRETRILPVSIPAELGLKEKRFLTLVFPPRIRLGEPAVIRLSLAANDMGNPDSAAVSTFYDTHQVIAEARFDLPGMSVRPSDLISAPISQGQTAVFYWTLRPIEAGQSRGAIWLYLRTVDTSTGRENREALSIQTIEIESVKLLGLSANQARLIGMVGMVAGIAMLIPFWGVFRSKLSRKQSEIL